ncbi:hypothetical protein [Actinoallomurus liliacearum]
MAMTAQPAPAVHDMRKVPGWSPVRGELRYGPWRISVWAEPIHPGASSLDHYVVSPLPNTMLRVAVMDAAVNANNGADAAEMGHHAVDTLAAGLRRRPSALDGIEAAHRRLHVPSRGPFRQPMATCAVVDLSMTSPSGRWVISADSEVWLRERSWRSVAGDALTQAARRDWDGWLREHPGAGDRERWSAQEALLGSPDAWNNPSVGAFAELKPASGEFGPVEEIVVSSDGARLSPGILNSGRLHDHLRNDLQVVPADHGHPWPHGDVTVLHVSWDGRNDAGLM